VEIWILFAFGSATFAALTTILAKIGLKNIDSHLATAIRAVVVLAFAWLMVFIVGSQHGIFNIESRTLIFLILSGLSTGASWLCFFRALQLGSVNRVVPIDKSSTIITMILAFIFLNEPAKPSTWIGMGLIGFGTWLMLEFKREPKSTPDEKSDKNFKKWGWLIFALLAAVFASLTAILGKIGIQNIEANLGTAIRTMAVVPMSWLMVFITKKGKNDKKEKINKKDWSFLVFSGIATGISWLFFYNALQIGPASLVVPIDKLSVVITMGFARFFLKERFSRRSLIGLSLLTFGTFLPLFL